MTEGTSQQANRRSAALEETMREFWATRPRRPHADRKAAGVAAGVAERYAIDPTLLRVAFVVATVFGGSGVLVYLLGWLLLPKEGEQASAFESLIGRGASSVSAAFSVLLCVALVPATSAMLGSTSPFGGPFSGPVGFAGLLAGLYLLHRSRAALGAVPAATGTGTGTSSGEGSQLFTQTQQAPPQAGAQDRGWDPLGAAPFAWDLPEPSTPQQEPPREPRRRGPRNGLIGLATALVTFAVCLLVAPLTGGWMTPVHIVGIVLAALGLSMVSVAFRGGAKGLVPVAVVLAAAGLLGTSTGLAGGSLGSIGDDHYQPTAPNQVHPAYNHSFGDLRLDLRGLPDSGQPVRTAVTSKFGDARVIVPANADVTLHCSSRWGHVSCLGTESRRGGSDLPPVVDNGADGKGGPAIDLTATSKFGNLEVTRG